MVQINSVEAVSRRGRRLVNTQVESIQDQLEPVRITSSRLRLQPPMHQERHQLIAEAAYRRAEARGFETGHDLEDWLHAEADVDARISAERAT